MRNYIPTAIIICVLTLSLTWAVLISLDRDEGGDMVVKNVVTQCPTWQNHLQVLDDWSDDFNANNPSATDDERRQAWYETLDGNNCERELPKCPTGAASFNAYWNNWSADYLAYHTNADVDAQMDAWNALMLENKCDEEWIDPLDDLIADYRGSTSTVSE